MKKALFLTTALFTNVALAGLTYQPSDVDTFITTARCPNCELSKMTNLNGLNIYMTQQIKKTGNTKFYMGANLQGADLTGSYLGSVDGYNLQNSNFNELRGSTANFAADHLDSSTFINAILEGAIFTDANLPHADFTGADLKGANFTRANLYGAKITPSQLSQITHCDTILPNDTISQSCTG